MACNEPLNRCRSAHALAATRPNPGRALEATLLRFTTAMRLQGWHVAPDRLAFDPVYARHWFALAHTCADDELRRLTVELFGQREALMTCGRPIQPGSAHAMS
jgi:hypothetical protein